MPYTPLEWLSLVATVSAGLMAGLFYVFSGFIMTALSRIPGAAGMMAMQSIDRAIINPIFMLLFFGTPIASGVSLYLDYQATGGVAVLVVAATALYVIGVLGITMTINVPMNNALDRATPDDGSELWRTYLRRWTGWNHVRTAASLASFTCLAMNLFA